MKVLQLPEMIVSPQDLELVILEIQNYAKWYLHNSIKLSVQAKNGTPQPTLSAGAIYFLREWAAGELLNKQLLEDLLTALDSLEKTTTHMSITLAAEPNSELRQTLVSWCRSNLDPSTLITFRANKTILGGMVVRFGSHVYDWSFRRQLQAQPLRFSEVLGRV